MVRGFDLLVVPFHPSAEQSRAECRFGLWVASEPEPGRLRGVAGSASQKSHCFQLLCSGFNRGLGVLLACCARFHFIAHWEVVKVWGDGS